MTASVVAALSAPVVIDRDGFPLSTYPMYSRARPAVVTLVAANGRTDDGDRVALSLGLIGESDDPLVVAGELRAAIADGRAGTRCAEIAARAVAAGARMADVAVIEVVSERHDLVDQVVGVPSLVERTVHASCEVGR